MSLNNVFFSFLKELLGNFVGELSRMNYWTFFVKIHELGHLERSLVYHDYS